MCSSAFWVFTPLIDFPIRSSSEGGLLSFILPPFLCHDVGQCLEAVRELPCALRERIHVGIQQISTRQDRFFYQFGKQRMNAVRQVVSLPGELVEMRLHLDQQAVAFEKSCKLTERCSCRITYVVRGKK